MKCLNEISGQIIESKALNVKYVYVNICENRIVERVICHKVGDSNRQCNCGVKTTTC